MGFGKNKSESSQGFDPQLKAALLSVFGEGQRLYNNLEFKPYEAARVAPMSPFQQEGLNQTLTNARGQLGNSELNDARAIFSRAGSYNPAGIGHRDVRAQGIGHRDINVAAMGAQPNVMANNISNVPLSGSRDVSNIPGVAGQSISPMALLGADQVNAERFSNTNLNPYLNQYEDQVVNQSISDIDRARQLQQGQNNAAAVAAGAFGGDRQAIQRAETDRNALEATARQVGQLRQGGYESAARRAEGDITRNLTGQQSNQASNSQTGQFNIGNEFNRQQANQARDLTASQANASNSIAAQRANQAADISNSQNNAANNMAMQRANQDANLRSQVQNQNMGFQTGQQNQNSAMQQQQLNQRVNFDAQRANQAARLQAAQGNQDTNFAAQRQNQMAGLQGMQQQLQAGQSMQGLGQDYRDFANQDAQNIFGVGSFQQQQAQRIMDDQYQRYQQEQEYPFKMFDLLRGAAGLLPGGTVGSSSSSGFNVGLPGGK